MHHTLTSKNGQHCARIPMGKRLLWEL